MTWNKDSTHIELRDKIGKMHEAGASLEEVARKLTMSLGKTVPTGKGKGKYTFDKHSVRWYWRCYCCSKASKINIEKHGGWSGYHKVFKGKNPNKYHQQHQECGRATTQKHGGWCGRHKFLQERNPERNLNISRRGGYATLRKYGGWYFFHVVFKEKNPKEYQQIMNDVGKRATERIEQLKEDTEAYTQYCLNISKRFREWHKKNYKQVREHLIRISPLGLKAQHENAPYEYDGEKFRSIQEVKCYKFLKSLGLTKEDITHEFQIDGKSIDFFLLNKIFWEHHPRVPFHTYGNLTPQEYYAQRRELLDKNGFKDYPLILTQSLKELPLVKQKIGEVL